MQYGEVSHVDPGLFYLRIKECHGNTKQSLPFSQSSTSSQQQLSVPIRSSRSTGTFSSGRTKRPPVPCPRTPHAATRSHSAVSSSDILCSRTPTRVTLLWCWPASKSASFTTWPRCSLAPCSFSRRTASRSEASYETCIENAKSMKKLYKKTWCMRCIWRYGVWNCNTIPDNCCTSSVCVAISPPQRLKR